MRYSKLDKLAVLRVLGSDRVGFLQGQLTQDLLKLSATQSLLAGWANPKGRLLCIMQLCQRGDEILAVLPADLLNDVMRRLQMFVLRADVRLEAAGFDVIGLLDLSQSGADQVAGLALPATPGACVSSDDLLLARTPDDSGRALALGDPQTLEALLANNGTAADADDWSRAGIAAGVPTISAAGSEAFVPQMVNLDLLGGISFSKGCYVGQEVVARTQNLGRIKRRMFRFALQGNEPVAAGEPLVDADGDKVGTVVTAYPPATAGNCWRSLRSDARTGRCARPAVRHWNCCPCPTKSRRCPTDYRPASRRCGNSRTSRIDGESVRNITSRSIPIPSPAVGGRPYSSAVM